MPHQPSSATHVAASTIRDWTHAGAIASMETAEGVHLVSISEVRAYAKSEEPSHRAAVKGRLGRTPSQLQRDRQVTATIDEAIHLHDRIGRRRSTLGYDLQALWVSQSFMAVSAGA
jgi:hypothetical protein